MASSNDQIPILSEWPTSQKGLFVPPPGQIDQNGYVHIPVRIADYTSHPSYNPSLVQKVRDKTQKKQDMEPIMIAMAPEDYIKYWAKDEHGTYLSSVQEPPQGRVEWLRYQVRVNEQWREWGQIRSLGTSPYSALYW